MAKKPDATTSPHQNGSGMLRQPAEVLYAVEIDELIKNDKHPKPTGWRM